MVGCGLAWLQPCTRAPSACGHIFASRPIVAASDIRGGSSKQGLTQWLRALGDGRIATLQGCFPIGSIATAGLDRGLSRSEQHDAGVIARGRFDCVVSDVVRLQATAHRDANAMPHDQHATATHLPLA